MKINSILSSNQNATLPSFILPFLRKIIGGITLGNCKAHITVPTAQLVEHLVAEVSRITKRYFNISINRL
jgi:hypothetical protein